MTGGHRSPGGDRLGCHPGPSAPGRVSAEGPGTCSGRRLSRGRLPAPGHTVRAARRLSVTSSRTVQTPRAGRSKIKPAAVLTQLNVELQVEKEPRKDVWCVCFSLTWMFKVRCHKSHPSAEIGGALAPPLLPQRPARRGRGQAACERTGPAPHARPRPRAGPSASPACRAHARACLPACLVLSPTTRERVPHVRSSFRVVVFPLRPGAENETLYLRLDTEHRSVVTSRNRGVRSCSVRSLRLLERSGSRTASEPCRRADSDPGSGSDPASGGLRGGQGYLACTPAGCQRLPPDRAPHSTGRGPRRPRPRTRRPLRLPKSLCQGLRDCKQTP